MTERDFSSILREHGGMLFRIASTYEADSSHRDDLLQDIALSLWRALPGWRKECALKTFAARVAHNRGVDHVIRQARLPRTEDLATEIPDEKPSPEGELHDQDQQRLLLAAIRQLPLLHKQVVTLALEGFAHAEIASALGITVNNVDVRLTRARKTLRKILGEKP